MLLGDGGFQDTLTAAVVSRVMRKIDFGHWYRSNADVFSLLHIVILTIENRCNSMFKKKGEIITK